MPGFEKKLEDNLHISKQVLRDCTNALVALKAQVAKRIAMLEAKEGQSTTDIENDKNFAPKFNK